MILNHAAADTAVQWKLCPNCKIHLLTKLEKYDLKSCSHRHYGPAEATPKFQISPQKLRKYLKPCSHRHCSPVEDIPKF